MNAKICIAKILTAHGVRGLVKIDCFLEDPSELESYNPLQSSDGKAFTVKLKNPVKGKFLAEINGITDRTEAEKYRNIELFIERGQLPDADEGFYHEDLTGCDVRNTDGKTIGRVIAVENFGAGDLLFIKPAEGKNYYLPFSEPYVLKTDIEENFLIADRTGEFL